MKHTPWPLSADIHPLGCDCPTCEPDSPADVPFWAAQSLTSAQMVIGMLLGVVLIKVYDLLVGGNGIRMFGL